MGMRFQYKKEIGLNSFSQICSHLDLPMPKIDNDKYLAVVDHEIFMKYHNYLTFLMNSFLTCMKPELFNKKASYAIWKLYEFVEAYKEQRSNAFLKYADESGRDIQEIEEEEEKAFNKSFYIIFG